MSDLMTIPYPLFVAGLFVKPDDRPGRMMHAAIGIVGEVQELLEADSRQNLIEEAGDLRFYIQAARNTDVEVDKEYVLCERDPYEGKLNTHACRACLRRHANEVLDMAKKWWVYEKPLDPSDFANELHQLELALSLFLGFLGISDEEVERHNRQKLAKRYPGGQYSNEAAQARADKAGSDMVGERKTILAAQWQSFEALALPADAPEIQRQEMKKAFFAGAVVVFGGLSRLADDDVSEELGAQVLQQLEDELRAYASSLPRNNDTTAHFPWH